MTSVRRSLVVVRMSSRRSAGALRATGCVVGLCLLLGMLGLMGMHGSASQTTNEPAVSLTTTAHSGHQQTLAATADHSAVLLSSAGEPQERDLHDGCPGGVCGGPTHHGNMQTAACMLALLAVAIVLLVPGLRTRLRAASGPTLERARALVRSLPQPRPPSLHVLSISRT